MNFKVKAIMNFNDLEENTHRNVGDVFEVNERRKEYLLEHNAIEVIKEKEEEKIEEIRNADLKAEIPKKEFDKLKKEFELKPKKKKSSKK